METVSLENPVSATLDCLDAARQLWDVVIIGAGPTGSLAARDNSPWRERMSCWWIVCHFPAGKSAAAASTVEPYPSWSRWECWQTFMLPVPFP